MQNHGSSPFARIWRRLPAPVRGILAAAFVFLSCYGVGDVGMWFALPQVHMTLIAPTLGVALGLVYLLGYWQTVPVVLGTWAYNAGMQQAGAALAAAVGMGVAALAGAWALRRWARIDPALERLSDVMWFLILGVGLSSAISGSVTALIQAASTGQWAAFGSLWWMCWVADLMGALVIAPALLTWANRPRLGWSLWKWPEAAALLATLLVVAFTVYGDLLMSELTRPLSYAVFPLVIWAALRFGVREVTAFMLITAGIAVTYTAQGLGPFAWGQLRANLLSLHGHLGMLALTGLLLSAALAERRRAGSDLAESEAKFRLIVENQSEFVLKLDPEGRVLFVSPSYCEAVGCREAELIGQPLGLPVADGEEVAERLAWEGLMQPPYGCYLEQRVKIRDQWRWIAWACKSALEPDGVVRAVVAVGRDITERRDAEERARQHLQELAHAGRLGAMGQMAAGLAHELNQPLCAIMSFSQACKRLLAQEADPAEVQRAIDRVVANAERAGGIIRQMRNFVRKDEPDEVKSADLNELVREVVSLTGPDAQRHFVRVRMDLDVNLPPVELAEIQIQQVLVNLIRNAIEAVDASPRERREVLIHTQALGAGQVQCSVSDTGGGIPPEIMGELFEPFVSNKHGGLGLGLSISRSIIQAHGGRLMASGVAGGGAQFTFTLPTTSEAHIHAG